MQEKRNGFHDRGYAVLAIGYFKANGTPNQLDRISLDAIAEAIFKVAEHQQIDSSRIALIGGSKGGEIVAVGTPEEVAKVKGSYTGKYLKRFLK